MPPPPLRQAIELGMGGAGSAPASARPYVRGSYALAALPGSETVYIRRRRQLVACTPELCPYGLGGAPEAIERLMVRIIIRSLGGGGGGRRLASALRLHVRSVAGKGGWGDSGGVGLECGAW